MRVLEVLLLACDAEAEDVVVKPAENRLNAGDEEVTPVFPKTMP